MTHRDMSPTCRSATEALTSRAGARYSRAVSGGTLETEEHEDTRVVTSPSLDDAEPAVGTTLDRFELLEEIGRGGMGIVYRARDPQLDRVVALKLVRTEGGGSSASDASATARARMLREAQALAAVSHPNVIPVYDVRRTRAGLCIAMEFVEGPTLRAWMREPRAWQDVVEVFAQAGAGLVAAHEAGLCHRDFKPSNVLVGTTKAGRPRVRVVDFGLARPAGEHVSEGGVFWTTDGSGKLTEAGSVVGTPSFMSPEQHRGGDVGPASDQYSFCVSLYWALYGELPFPSRGRSLRQVLAYKMQCALPRTPPERKAPAWLHSIVLRGLRPDPSDRFASMAVLLSSLRSGRGRRMWWVGAAGLGAASLAGFMVDASPRTPCEVAMDEPAPWTEPQRTATRDALSATAGGEEAWQQLDDALTEYSQRWASAREAACAAGTGHDVEAVRAGLDCLHRGRRSVDALAELFGAADGALLRRTRALVDALPPPQACVGDDAPPVAEMPLPEDPRRAAEAAETARELARVSMIMSAGRYDEAAEVLRPVEARARVLAHPPLLARVLLRKGQISRLRGKYALAEEALVASHTAAREGADPLTVIDASTALVYLLGYRLSRHDEGERWYREAEAAIIRANMNESREAALLLDNWGSVLTDMGRFDEALATHRRALAVGERVEGVGAPGTAVSISNVGAALLDLGRADEARVQYERSLEIRKAAYGLEHPKVISTMVHLGSTYDELGETALARGMLEDALALQERVLGPDHMAVATSATNLSAVLHREREFERALELQQRALAIWTKAYAGDHARVAIGHNNVASTLRKLGRYDDAVTHYERALAVAEVSMGSKHPTVGTFLDNLGDMMRKAERYDDALAYYDRSLEVREAAYGDSHRAVADSLADIALTHKAQGEFDTSLDYQSRANVIYRDTLGEEHPSYLAAQSNLANVMAKVGDLSGARSIHERTLAKRVARFGADHFETASSYLNLADVLLELGEPSQALEHFETAYRIWARELPADDSRTVVAKAGRDACRKRLAAG